MIDAKIVNGDIALDSNGEVVKISDEDALFQSAMIRICAQSGKFIYDRELGSEFERSKPSDELAIQRAELLINEAIAQLKNSHAVVCRADDDGLTIKLTINGETRLEEVRFDGKL